MVDLPWPEKLALNYRPWYILVLGMEPIITNTQESYTNMHGVRATGRVKRVSLELPFGVFKNNMYANKSIERSFNKPKSYKRKGKPLVVLLTAVSFFLW